MEIREFKLSDVDEMIENEERIFLSSLGKDFTIEQLKEDSLIKYLLLVDDDKIIGQLGLWIDDFRAQIINFYIIEDYRRKGLGEKLLNYGIDFLKQKKVNIITLEVRVSNKIAQNLYSKEGFSICAIRKNYYSDGEDAFLLVRNF